METENVEQGSGQAQATQMEIGSLPSAGSHDATDSGAATVQGEEAVASLKRIEKTLERMADYQIHSQRVEQMREFSLLDLAGSLCVVVAAVLIIAALLSLLRTDAYLGRAWATVALLGAIAMEGLSMAISRSARRK